MKTLTRSAMSLLIVVIFFASAMPPAWSSAAVSSVAGSASSSPAKRVKDAKVKKGPEVAARVRQLKESSENVRAALRYFDKKGKPSKIDESFAIYGSYRSTNTASLNTYGSFIKPVSFSPASYSPASYNFAQESSIGDANVEIIFVPSSSLEGEWQGTVIANRYDDYGNFVEQYVAESVMTMPDPNNYSWDEIYEAPVSGGEVQPPVDEPGMYTDYNWGSPREQQPMDYQYMAKRNKGRSSDKAFAADDANIVKASLAQTRRARVRAWARCSFAWCGGAGVACVAVNVWNAELLAGPCFAIGCITSAIGCTWGTLWQ